MDNNIILKRFFSKSILHDLLSGNKNEVFDCVVRRYISEPDGKSYGDLVSEIYTYLGNQYRTEYFYKNTMLNKLLLKKHNYRKTVVLSELPVANSKADFIMINGNGVVYEIKTELDNLERLNAQIQDYYKAFTKVCVVTYEDNLEKVIKIIPETVGIMVLTKRKALRTLREPVTENKYLDVYTIFKILRKYEFENIIQEMGYELPDVNQFKYYKRCLEILFLCDIEKLQKSMLGELKKRMKIEIVEFSLELPEELRFLSYMDESILKYKETGSEILNNCYGG